MKRKKGISKISIIIIVIIIILISLLVYALIPKQRKASSKKKVNEISSPEDFKNVGEAIEFTGSKMLSQDGNNLYVTLKYPTYTNNMSNQKYYLNLMSYVAETLEYKSFNIIDKDQNIDINVTCDKDLENITDYKINGISNYFGKEDSKIAIKNYTEIPNTTLNVQSNIITKTINKNWEYNDIDYGTLESTFDERKIYFEEGIDVRVIENDHMASKVYNVIFNKRYTGNVVNNISTKCTIEEVKNILGEPAFDYNDGGIIGYKSDKIYAFFVKDIEGIEISIYPVELYDTDGFAKAVTKFLSYKKYNTLQKQVFDSWPDTWSYVENEITYITKGVKLEFNTSNPSGVTLYKNFKGKITEDITIEQVLNGEKELPDNVYFENEDSVFLCEKERNTRYYFDENLTESNDIFYVVPINMNGASTLKFVSIDEKNPDFEIIDNIKSYMWIDDTHFIYGVSNKGIFMVDVLTRKQIDVVRGTSIYNITKYEDGVVYYDNTYINFSF